MKPFITHYAHVYKVVTAPAAQHEVERMQNLLVTDNMTTYLSTGTAVMTPPRERKRNVTLHTRQRVRVRAPHWRQFPQLSNRQVDIGTEWWADV